MGIILMFGLLPHSSLAQQEDLMVGHFSAGDVLGWTEKVFSNRTLYTLIPSDHGKVIRADSTASASTYYRDIRIDLNKTPCLNWSWNVDHALEGLDETTKAGDDFAARIYVVFSGGIAFWKTRALNYVWSGQKPIGTSWPNAFTKNSINIVVQSGQKRTKEWVQESRNVRDDFLKLMGEDMKIADGVAIMTDTDNSKGAATAYFGDIYFSKSC